MPFLETFGASAAMLSMAATVFLVAGFVKGVVGLGLPTVSMALLALMMAPAQAAVLLVVPSLFTNLWQLRPWRTAHGMLGRLWPMLLGVCVGTWVGAWAFGAPAGAWSTIALGVALICYAVWGLLGSRFSLRPQTEIWLGPWMGAMTGLVTAATGVFVVPTIPYLEALALRRDELVQAMGISFTVSTLALAVGLCFTTSTSVAALGISTVMLVPALGGMWLGQVLRMRLSHMLFRRCLLGCVFALGMYMIAHEILRH